MILYSILNYVTNNSKICFQLLFSQFIHNKLLCILKMNDERGVEGKIFSWRPEFFPSKHILLNL